MQCLGNVEQMRICLIITGMGVGGAETQVANLAKAFSSLGHAVLLVVLTGEVALDLGDTGAVVQCLGMRKSPADFVRAYRDARSIISSFNPDVVHSHMVHANIFARLLRISLPMKKLICTAHSKNEGGQLRMLAYRITDRLADFSTNVSHEAVQSYIEKGAVPSGRILAVYNGVDTECFKYSDEKRCMTRKILGVSEESKMLLAVGRLYEAKDYPNLIKAFSIVSRSHPSCNLVIAGDGPLREKIESIVDNLGLKNKVQFLGIRHDVSALMCAADVFVLSSDYEGFGLVVAEAMACERLVVATDCGGVSEVVGGHGVLVSPRDSNQLSKGIIKLLDMPANERANLGKDARAWIAANYSLKASVSEWLNLYRGEK
jgi:glycosyltransferase involved in cell wall biosynthesis